MFFSFFILLRRQILILGRNYQCTNLFTGIIFRVLHGHIFYYSLGFNACPFLFSLFLFSIYRCFLFKYNRFRFAVDAAKEVITLREKRYGEHIKKTLQPGKAIKRIGDLQKARKKAYLIRAPLQSKRQASSAGETEQKMDEQMETN